MTLDDSYRSEPILQPVEYGSAGVAIRTSYGGPDQVPNHAGGAPPMAVTYSDDESVVGAGHADDRISVLPRELVRLRRRIHDLEAIQPSGYESVKTLPMIPPVFRQ